MDRFANQIGCIHEALEGQKNLSNPIPSKNESECDIKNSSFLEKGKT